MSTATDPFTKYDNHIDTAIFTLEEAVAELDSIKRPLKEEWYKLSDQVDDADFKSDAEAFQATSRLRKVNNTLKLIESKEAQLIQVLKLIQTL
jgi:hypothetical protein